MVPSEEILSIARKYKLKLAAYFGSYMTDSFNVHSDIDIAYLSSYPLSAADKMQLLEDLIIAHRKSEIDLVDLQEAGVVLRCEVAIKGKVLYEEEEGLFETYSLYFIKQFYELKSIIQEDITKTMSLVREVTGNA